jgi:hypothetical protein
MVVAGHRTLISYEGQPATCYGCNETGHLYTACHHRRRAKAADRLRTTTSWADVAAKEPALAHAPLGRDKDTATTQERMDTLEPPTTDSTLTSQEEETRRRGDEGVPAKESTRVMDSAEEVVDHLTRTDRRRRAQSADHATPNKEGVAAGMDRSEERHTVRRQTGGGGRPVTQG